MPCVCVINILVTMLSVSTSRSTPCRHSDVYMAYLPLAHILELVAEISCMYSGVRIGYGTTKTLISGATGLKENCQGDLTALKPTRKF